jgi:nitrite reductase/ring-hydroxylating ferredoxin subunit
MTTTTAEQLWHKVLEPDELAEGRVKPATCAHLTLCMTHYNGQYGALNNKGPHQGDHSARDRLKMACYAAHGTARMTIH